MESNPDIQALRGSYSQSPLYVASQSPQARIKLRTDNPFQQNFQGRKKIDPFAVKDYRIHKTVKKLNQSSNHSHDDSYLKQIIKSSSLAGNKQIILYKLSRRHNKTQSQKRDNSHFKGQLLDAVSIEPMNIRSKDQEDIKLPGHRKAVTVSLNSQAIISKKDQSPCISLESLNNKTKNNYNHFKRTMPSFWNKDNITINVHSPPHKGPTTPSRPNTIQAGINRSLGTGLKSSIVDEEDKNDLLNTAHPSRKHFLSLARVNIGSNPEKSPNTWKDLTPSNASQFTGHLTKYIEKANFLSLDMGYESLKRTEDQTKNEPSIYVSNRDLKQSEIKNANDGDLISSFRKYTKDSARIRLSATDGLIMNENEHNFTSKYFSQQKNIVEDLHSDGETSHKVSPNNSHRNINLTNLSPTQSVSESVLHVKSICKKLKETLNPEGGQDTYDVKNSKKSGYIFVNVSNTKTKSMQDKTIDIPEPYDVGKLGAKKRAGTASITLDKRLRIELDKTPKQNPQYAENIEDFELEGWDPEGEGQNEF